MTTKTITFSRKITYADQVHTSLTLREMEAGDYFDAGAQVGTNASRAELEARVAAICADVPFELIRKLRPADIVKISNWYDEQWKAEAATGEGGDDIADPSKAGAAGLSS